MKQYKMKQQKFVLLKEIDWFGKTIKAGTIYTRVNADYFHPTFKGARYPSLQIDFYTVLNNPIYFLEINI